MNKVSFRFLLFSFLVLSFINLKAKDILPSQDYQTFDSYKEIGYDQSLRPRFHFTSLKNWINDPNGMVWYDGEYHLYFQHNPTNIKWELGLVWGHAVSTDMVHWTQLPHAILPQNSKSGIYSGTAVVDQNNSLGFQRGKVKTLVTCFTYAGGQSIAYSTDKGRSYQFLNNGKPVLLSPEYKGARDPKLFWHEASKSWVMVLWVQKVENEGKPEEKPGKIQFFTSKDLINWDFASEINRNWAYECMDLVELPVDGNKKNKKWLLYDASFDYEIGDFDGKVFTSDKKTYLGDFGPNFYAGQSFSNSPDNRTVMMGWMKGGASIFQKAEMPFSQQMSFPTTMELKTTAQGIRLFRLPVKEIENLYVKTYTFNNLNAKELTDKLTGIKLELMNLSFEINPTNFIKLSLRGNEITYEKMEQCFIFKNKKIPAKESNGKVKLRVLLDRTSVELFVNDGEAVATFYAVPEHTNKNITVSANESTVFNCFTINELKSSWVTGGK